MARRAASIDAPGSRRRARPHRPLGARLREPGFEYKATLESEMQAAIAGGVTSLACPPDTDPPLDEPGLVEMLKHRARSLNQAHVYPIGALTVRLQRHDADRDGRAGRSRMRRVLAGRCAAGRHAGAAARDAIRGDVRLSRLAAAQRSALSARAASRTTAKWRRGWACRASRRLPRRSRSRRFSRWCARPACACTCAGLSTAEGVAMVRAAKAEGLPVTCDVAIHHLHLCDVDIGWFDVATPHLVPPLRTTRDRAALRAGARRRHHRPHLLRSRAGRRRRQAGAVRRSGAGRDGPRTPAAAHAQMGCGRESGAACGAGADHVRAGRAPRRRTQAHLRGRGAGGCLRVRPGTPTGRSSARRSKSQGKNTPFLGSGGSGQGAADAGRRAGRVRRLRRRAEARACRP